MNFVKRIAHARTSKFVFFVVFNIPDIVKVLKSKNSQGRNEKNFLGEKNCNNASNDVFHCACANALNHAIIGKLT